MHIEVRLASNDDLEMLHSIIAELEKCDIELRGERFEEALRSELTCYLIATCDGKAAGFINIWAVPDIVDGRFIGIIPDCYVLGQYRGKGIGEMLMEAAMDFGRDRKIDKFFAWVDPENKPAISLLKKFGFDRGSLMLEKKE
jgi:ribosomal protein S18 acetylase RimI-like enzyme